MSTQTKRKSLKYWLAAIALIVLFMAAVYKVKKSNKGESVEVSEVVERTVIERVLASGKIYPEKEVKISSDVSGEIVELYVQEGDSVRAGQLLVKIDPESYTSAVSRGVASLNNAKAQLSVSRSSVKNAEAQRAQIRAQLDNAQLVQARNESLHNDGVISRQDLESSESNLKSLEANFEAAQASVESAQESVKAAEFTVASQEAALKELRTSLNRTSIVSPTDGVVSMLNVEEGERVVGTIQMTGTEIMRISNFSSMEVRVEVSENDILRVNLGDKAEIEVDAYSDRTFDGVVSEIANSAANVSTTTSLTSDQVTNFVVKIRIDAASYGDLIQPNQIFPLRPGMSASAEIFTEEAHQVLTVPIESVTARELDKDTNAASKQGKLTEVVFKVVGDTVSQVEVTTGIQDENFIEIKSGLAVGDRIVKGPYNTVAKKLKSGDKVVLSKDKEKKD